MTVRIECGRENARDKDKLILIHGQSRGTEITDNERLTANSLLRV